MTNYAAKIAGAATLALAALPMVAMTTAAHAEPMKVSVAGIDLSSKAGQQAFAHRVQVAGREFCATEKTFTGREACLSGVRAEATEKMTALESSQHYAGTATIAAR